MALVSGPAPVSAERSVGSMTTIGVIGAVDGRRVDHVCDWGVHLPLLFELRR
jgi:hypothetical protein